MAAEKNGKSLPQPLSSAELMQIVVGRLTANKKLHDEYKGQYCKTTVSQEGPKKK